MQQDDFVTAVIESVAEIAKISKKDKDKIDETLRFRFSGEMIYIKKRGPCYRDAIRAATGTAEEIALMFDVNERTVRRVRKGR
jgi:hypothetical protein